MLRWEGFWAITAAIAGLGIGHALIRAPQTALAIGAAVSGARLGAVRLFERLGALIGLMASAFWLAEFGAEAIINAMAAVVLVGGAVFSIMLRVR